MKTKNSNTVMTVAFLFLSPIVAASVAAGAQSATKAVSAILLGAGAVGLTLFWIAVFRAYTARIRTIGRLEGTTRAIVILGGSQNERQHGDAN